MGLDEAGDADITELVREHGSPRQLGAQLGGGEAQSEGKECAAEAQAKRRMPEGQAES